LPSLNHAASGRSMGPDPSVLDMVGISPENGITGTASRGDVVPNFYPA